MTSRWLHAARVVALAGCDLAQGCHVGRPGPPEALDDVLASPAATQPVG